MRKYLAFKDLHGVSKNYFFEKQNFCQFKRKKTIYLLYLLYLGIFGEYLVYLSYFGKIYI